MEEIEKDLSKGSVDRPPIDKQKLHKAIKEVAKTKIEQKEVARKLSRLMENNAGKQKKVQNDIEKLLEQNKMEELSEKIKSLERQIQNKDKVVKLMEQLLNSQDRQKKLLRLLKNLCSNVV